MTLVALRCFLLASAPAAFWLWLFYRRDRWEPEPKSLVLRMFLFGALAAAPTYLFQVEVPGPILLPIIDFFIRVPLVEEFFKILPVLWLAWRSPRFNEPMDGILYAVAAALGFATVENALYAMRLGPGILVQRAFTSTLAHAALSGLVGYHIGMARTHPDGRAWRVLAAFLAVVALHGAYDLLLQTAAAPGSSLLLARLSILVVIPSLLALLSWAVRLADRASPFRAPAS